MSCENIKPYSKKTNPISRGVSRYSKKTNPISNGIPVCPYLALQQGGLLKTKDNKFILIT